MLSLTFLCVVVLIFRFTHLHFCFHAILLFRCSPPFAQSAQLKSKFGKSLPLYVSFCLHCLWPFCATNFLCIFDNFCTFAKNSKMHNYIVPKYAQSSRWWCWAVPCLFFEKVYMPKSKFLYKIFYVFNFSSQQFIKSK